MSKQRGGERERSTAIEDAAPWRSTHARAHTHIHTLPPLDPNPSLTTMSICSLVPSKSLIPLIAPLHTRNALYASLSMHRSVHVAIGPT